ncbi:nitroreductase family protein [Lignipirellula cremea]|uniref:Malonic semialdehyde reductase n=1 Tax=Lignipirellula cremea TaxID=2528010 RepID=A0A518DN00_9BACT|nr:nitroreductase family protein [Lignipirellula cremea]QDU93216.1 malonic semialdehyde reductase [Lignipirellula cremea]
MTEKHIKHADTDYPVHPLIAQRWSPYAFAPRVVENAKLLSCLEAARWAASSYNEQPWTFLVARREDSTEFQRLLGCLLEANQEWAQHAGVLILTVICPTFSRNGKPNRVAEHDLGLAAGNLSLQAESLGLYVHQMAGVNLQVARQTYSIPETHQPVTAIAIGYAASEEAAPSEELAQRDRQPRQRKPLSEWVFQGGWKNPADLS